MSIASEGAGVGLLSTECLSKQFGGLSALSDLSLSVPRGQVRGIIGPNGAGKSTFFNLVSGHLKPSAGRILFDGRDITGLAPHAIARRGIARKFQITQVFQSLSVFQNLALGAQQRNEPSIFRLLLPVEVGEAVAQTIRRVRLAHKRDTQASELSHGEQQRLELGMVLATGARLLLLDEPTAGMSVEERAEMAEVIRGIAGDATIVITEHDFEFIKEVVDLVTVLNNGAKLADGTVAQIENDPAVRACYLGSDDA